PIGVTVSQRASKSEPLTHTRPLDEVMRALTAGVVSAAPIGMTSSVTSGADSATLLGARGAGAQTLGLPTGLIGGSGGRGGTGRPQPLGIGGTHPKPGGHMGMPHGGQGMPPNGIIMPPMQPPKGQPMLGLLLMGQLVLVLLLFLHLHLSPQEQLSLQL